MATVIELAPSPEQREELAREFLQKIADSDVALSEYEKQVAMDIIAGRAVTVGRYQAIKEASERLFGVKQC